MKTAHKLFLVSVVLALLIWAVGLYAVAVSRRALRRSIERTSASLVYDCLLYTSPSPRDRTRSRMPSSA